MIMLKFSMLYAGDCFQPTSKLFVAIKEDGFYSTCVARSCHNGRQRSNTLVAIGDNDMPATSTTHPKQAYKSDPLCKTVPVAPYWHRSEVLHRRRKKSAKL